MMSITPTTRASMLLLLRDPRDHDAWVKFVSLYEPVICRVLRKTGLQDSDGVALLSEDMQQLAAVHRLAPRTTAIIRQNLTFAIGAMVALARISHRAGGFVAAWGAVVVWGRLR